MPPPHLSPLRTISTFRRSFCSQTLDLAYPLSPTTDVTVPSQSIPQPTTTPPATINNKSSPHHNDLLTFLSYANRTSLSPTSPVYKGTHYEYICASTLPRLGFTHISRTGGRSDHGIDLLALWQLPSLPFPLRVLVQCKGTKSKSSPQRIRELEGAVVGAPVGWRGKSSTVALLCGKREATKGVMDAVRRCGIPVVWCMIEERDSTNGEKRAGVVRQMLWNGKVEEQIGGRGWSVGVRYGGKSGGGESVLMWEGREWDPAVERWFSPWRSWRNLPTPGAVCHCAQTTVCRSSYQCP